MKGQKDVKMKQSKMQQAQEKISCQLNLETINHRETKVPDFKYGQVWQDPVSGHRIGCLDAAKKEDVKKLMQGKKSQLSIQDPPYNIGINHEFRAKPVNEYLAWTEQWIDNNLEALAQNGSLYIWLGADIKNGLQPFTDFVLMMRNKPIKLKNFITMRNQRGYGTQKNWMAVRQELLYYTKGKPVFNVEATYTNIPKKTNGYYKEINGKLTENRERSKSPFIRAGNVWIDIQQIFYLLKENVEGCYAQKPLKSLERIIKASSQSGDIITDFFSHSGATLVQAEISKRKCYTMDISPAYCKISAARLLHYRNTGQTGWQRTKVVDKQNILANDKVLLFG